MVYNLLSFASVMKSIGGVVLAIVILLAMVTIHEFGHYVAGKLLGFKINEFAVGFGPAIFKKRSKKTGELFALRVIPLGGYCAFDGEDELVEERKAEEPFAEMSAPQQENEGGMSATNEEYPEPKGARFNDQAPWKRIIVLIAGATMNYLLALLIIIGMFAFIGQPLYRVVAPDETGYLDPAYAVGDIIESIEDKNVYLITDYMDALEGKKEGETHLTNRVKHGKITR